MKLDFLDPQSSKGACDRKAASLKNKIKMYLNSEKGDQMKAAIESLGGVQSVNVILCDLPTVPEVEAPKWEGVSFINNFEYHKDGIRTWQEYGTGPDKFLRWSHFSFAEKHPILHLNVQSQHMKTQPGPNTQTRRVKMQLKTSSFLVQVRDV